MTSAEIKQTPLNSNFDKFDKRIIVNYILIVVIYERKKCWKFLDSVQNSDKIFVKSIKCSACK